MIKALCDKKQVELEKINYIEEFKSRPSIYLKTLKGTANISWLYDIGAQATCLSETLFNKIPKNFRPKKLQSIEGMFVQVANPLNQWVITTWHLHGQTRKAKQKL